mmetsp:Transcript_22754/g.74074  ORF Transcript_22754/g.74074 Transcript_22754/m.74074 type:complete len:541 (-) Transcript_22754:239-1861(-)
MVSVGARVVSVSDGAQGWARFTGAVADESGVWVGVEWDDPARGKHDGTLRGTRYFECASATSGSFVRAPKLRVGVDYATAVRRKYAGDDDDEENGNGTAVEGEQAQESGGAYVESASGRRVEVELCGKDQAIAKLKELAASRDRVYLPNALVATAGDPGSVSGATPRATELDLTGALIPDWSEVAAFGRELPALRMLNLSQTRARFHPAPEPSAFAALETLILNGCALEWEQVEAVSASAPELKELSLSDAGLKDLGRTGSHCTCLSKCEALNLEGNALGEWSAVARLAQLPRLARLHLNRNGLTSVSAPAAEGEFASLRVLLLADNAVEGWPSVDALDCFPALEETRLTGNPVAAGPQTRHEIVARVGRLTQLNGSVIGRAERRDAEIRYLRRALAEAQATTGGGDNTAAQAAGAPHPRLADLRAEHGELAVGAAGAGGPGKLADELMKLTLTCVAPSAGERMPVEKKLPRTLTVAKLKVLCAKLFKVPVEEQRIFACTPGIPVPEEVTDADGSDLHALGVVDGAQMLIDDVSSNAGRA